MVNTTTFHAETYYPSISELLERANSIVQEHGCASSLSPDEGIIQRLGTTRKPHGKDFAAILHFDRPANVSYCNYHDDAEWHVVMLTHGIPYTEQDKKAFRERLREIREIRQYEQKELKDRAAITARELYNTAPGCTEHPYFSRKHIPFVPGLRLTADNKIIVPIYKTDGKLTSLQFIDHLGNKRFLPHGDCCGGYFPIAGSSSGCAPLLICEGLATAISLNVHTGYDTACAFFANNLRPVAECLRSKFPSRKIILCADNDSTGRKPDGTLYNVGVEKARIAAAAIGGFSIAPPAIDGKPTDFNDLASLIQG